MIARHYKNLTIKFHDTRAFKFLQIIDITQALLHQHCELISCFILMTQPFIDEIKPFPFILPLFHSFLARLSFSIANFFVMPFSHYEP